MADYYTKRSKYFAQTGTEAQSKGLLPKDQTDVAGQFTQELSEKAKAYSKVASRAVTKRYAARKD